MANVHYYAARPEVVEPFSANLRMPPTNLIRHDYSSSFKSAETTGGQTRTPLATTKFSLTITGETGVRDGRDFRVLNGLDFHLSLDRPGKRPLELQITTRLLVEEGSDKLLDTTFLTKPAKATPLATTVADIIRMNLDKTAQTACNPNISQAELEDAFNYAVLNTMVRLGHEVQLHR
jgi:hypothetical protein